MNKMFEFFNKIMGLMIFLIAITLLINLFHHRHHFSGWHHRHFSGAPRTKDTLNRVYRDSMNRQ